MDTKFRTTHAPEASSSGVPLSPPAVKPPRLDSVDLLRGIVMVLMALDHVRDFFTEVRYDPLDLTQTSVALFFTRWVTHFCAPVFVFLAGTGAFLSGTRGKTKPEVARFLLTRGLWLIVVELTLVRFGWVFNLDYTLAIGQVIWAIGWSMIILAGLIFLSLRTIAIIGVGMIAFHNTLDGIDQHAQELLGWLWQILHTGGVIAYLPGHVFWVAYPLIPWIGVMAAGYAFGALLLKEEQARRRNLLRHGLGLTLAFVVIRFTNLYGDPSPWSGQERGGFTVLSFLNCTKYPPSLLFLLMTLGPAIAVLPWFEKVRGGFSRFFIVFGRVPMFYYLLHIPLAHLLAVLTALAMGFDPSFMMSNTLFDQWPSGYGFGLPVVYVVWILVVLILYPVCRWFAELKRRRKDVWLSYL